MGLVFEKTLIGDVECLLATWGWWWGHASPPPLKKQQQIKQKIKVHVN